MSETRQEERYLMKGPWLAEFVRTLEKISKQEKFPTEYNQTLYFNNVEHEVPFGVSIKCRKYSSLPWGDSVELSPEETWILEIKSDVVGGGSILRHKERKNMSLKEASEVVNSNRVDYFQISDPITPYISDNYHRAHYLVKGNSGIRVTVDSDIEYYFFQNGVRGSRISKENYSRVEIKIPKDSPKSPEGQMIAQKIQELNAEPIISKKDMAYNALSRFLKNKNRSYIVGPSDTEIEAKLSLDGSRQNVFHRIKKDFLEGLFEGFFVPQDYPYTLESGRLHKYVVADDGYLRIGVSGEDKTVTVKENLQLAENSYGLRCVTKRIELKDPPKFDITDVSRLPSETVYRKRKYFIVKKKDMARDYCVMIDRTTYGGNEMYQMEIEGLLLSPSVSDEKEVVEDIAFLTSKMLKRYDALSQTTVTKLDWLKNFVRK